MRYAEGDNSAPGDPAAASNAVDPSGSGWTGFPGVAPTGQEGRPPVTGLTGDPHDTRTAVQPRPDSVAGEVRGLQSRTETLGDRPKIVWTFRLERYDAAGNRLRPVAVEMKGYEFHGAIHEGDQVEVRGRLKSGTLNARDLYNSTTGARVRAGDRPIVRFVGCAVLLAVVAALILAAIFIATTLMRQFERDIEQRRNRGAAPTQSAWLLAADGRRGSPPALRGLSVHVAAGLSPRREVDR